MARSRSPLPFEALADVPAQIRRVIADAIEAERLSTDDNYVEQGLDSITAIRVVAQLRKLGLNLMMRDVLTAETVGDLAERVGTHQLTEVARTPQARAFELAIEHQHEFPPEVVDAYPATSMALHMIQTTGQDVAQAAYHDVFSYRLAVPLDETLLRASLATLLNGHETLRSAFALTGYSTPMQLIYERVEPRLQVFDLASLPREHQEAAFSDWFEREKQTGFAWHEPGLIRFFAHRHSAGDFTLTISFHHSIIDGWSLSLFVRDLVMTYSLSVNDEPTPPLTFPALKYREYVRAELASRESKEDRDFWRERLRGHTYRPIARRTPCVDGQRWSETKIVLDAARMSGLSSAAAEVGAPLKYLTLACHLRVLSVIEHCPDVVTGVVTGGRLEEDEGELVLGLFLNFLPLRQRIGDQSWRQLVHEALASDRESVPHRRYPFTMIEHPDGPGPLFDALFNYTQFTAYRDLAPGGKRGGLVTDVRWFEHAGVPLLANVAYQVWHEPRLVITLNADAAVLPQETVENVGALYSAFLAQLAGDPDSAATDMSDETAELAAWLQAPALLSIGETRF